MTEEYEDLSMFKMDGDVYVSVLDPKQHWSDAWLKPPYQLVRQRPDDFLEDYLVFRRQCTRDAFFRLYKRGRRTQVLIAVNYTHPLGKVALYEQRAEDARSMAETWHD